MHVPNRLNAKRWWIMAESLGEEKFRKSFSGMRFMLNICMYGGVGNKPRLNMKVVGGCNISHRMLARIANTFWYSTFDSSNLPLSFSLTNKYWKAKETHHASGYLNLHITNVASSRKSRFYLLCRNCFRSPIHIHIPDDMNDNCRFAYLPRERMRAESSGRIELDRSTCSMSETTSAPAKWRVKNPSGNIILSDVEHASKTIQRTTSSFCHAMPCMLQLLHMCITLFLSGAKHIYRLLLLFGKY